MTVAALASSAQLLLRQASLRPSVASASWVTALVLGLSKIRSVTPSCPKRLQVLQIEMNCSAASLTSRSVHVARYLVLNCCYIDTKRGRLGNISVCNNC